MRKQNSSCDQCRKGKRACDAGAVKDVQVCLDSELQWDANCQDLTGPCSNCLKTSKRCTFDWARSQQLQIRERRQSSTSDNRPPPSRKRAKSTHATALPSSVFVGESETFQNFFHLLDPNQTNFLQNENPDMQNMLSGPLFQATSESFMMSPTNETVSSDSFPDDLSLVLPASSSTSLRSGISDELPGLDEVDVVSAHDPSVTGLTPTPMMKAAARPRKRSWKGRREVNFQPGGISAFSPAQQMISRTNNGLMTDNLMRLYHDVMEGALACWLTEQNCPYLTPAKSENLDFQVRDSSSSFPNRIYHRVVKLDKSLGSLGIKPLTTLEDRKATRALHFSIMAFTAQWAQGSQRSQARYDTTMFNDNASFSGFGEDFDATLQSSFWNQARKHLDDCSEVNSFKVAFAELVFGLTQKYATDTEELLFSEPATDFTGCSGNLTERIQEALARDEHNVYVERGARRLHVLRRRVECFDRKVTSSQPGQIVMSRTGRKGANCEERRTLELIFWLAVMFDTLTAAMTERPLAVSDEDSKDLSGRGKDDESDPSKPATSASDWNDRFIIKRHQKLAPLRWPCPEGAIARELRDAAPVKVLLFRKITRLQTLSARDAGEQAIEHAIQDALSVYRHWNMTYGPLFQDCIQYHDSLPPKVKSWYVCLLGHWLLAVMILADAIHLMDEQGLSVQSKASDRVETGIAAHLRNTTSRMASDLASASTPRQDDVGQLEEYHHAVNEGALLTEPWTMMLIRSFAMAGLSLLDETTGGRRETGLGATPCEELFIRCENCVKALWYLGRKSSLSMEVARILGDGLERARFNKFCMEEASCCVGLDAPTGFGQVKV